MENPNNDEGKDELPGFRFHPTDEELVGFYLRRKVENKPITIDLIKSIDIYRYDPWDLPKSKCGGGGEKEWYLFCKRGRKYKNSVRPNRVTASGFWKATGIDKPVRSLSNASIIGLKKTLVYYRGCAGKGTKTDWMMHEFRLPVGACSAVDVDDLQEAEIWTICRIFKRSVSYRKYTSDWRELSVKNTVESKNKVITKRSETYKSNSFIDFSAVPGKFHQDKKPKMIMNHMNNTITESANYNHVLHVSHLSSLPITTHDSAVMKNMESKLFDDDDDENDKLFTTYANWDELRAVVDYALHPHLM